MSRILVTGGNGFVGRHAVRDLINQGHEVIIASRTGNALHDSKSAAVDLLSATETEQLVEQTKPETLLHLAWETESGLFWEAQSNSQWLEASNILVKSFFENGGTRAVFAGTCAEYDWTALEEDGLVNENATPLAPATPYGRAKLAFSNTVSQFIEDGFSCAWARLFFLFGEGEQPTRFVPSIVRNLLAGRPAPMSSGEQLRDFLDTRDAGRGFARLCESDVSGSINLASGRGVTLKSVAASIGELVGRPELVDVGALPDRANEPGALVADVSRLTHELGFSPTVGMEDGLRHAVEYWRHRCYR